ncbi:MAG: acyl-CoA synthetase [Gammaproteobacteria bacterium]|nr:acyl-CoA synthetase [Gammaproteobacteria bacterium]
MPFNVAAINEAVTAAVPEREALVYRDRRFTYAQLADRANRLANVLLAHDVTVQHEREGLANWESGQDHVALYMYNCNEYLEGMLGGFKARAAPFNVNYRYVAEELVYLLHDAQTTAIIYQACFAATLAPLLQDLPGIKLLLQVDDGSDVPLLPGALDYEQALASTSGMRPDVELDDDDLYILYTGGTTGMPKGVLWRQADCAVANLGGRWPDGRVVESLDGFRQRAEKSRGLRIMPASPFMHGAGSYVSFNAWGWGNTVIIQDETQRFDAHSVLATCARERASMLLTIGDAFGRPLLEAARSGRHDLSSIRIVMNTGAILSDAVKDGLIDVIPGLRISDSLGTSETGPQGNVISDAGSAGEKSRFRLMPDAEVLSADLKSILKPGDDELGWLVKRNFVPLGYLGDQAKTEATFPVVDGDRYVIGGDRVRLLADGVLEYHGRESFTINSGGEKIFAEEVEIAIKHHPDIIDVVVVGRPSERWGNEVVAIIQARGQNPDRDNILQEAAKHVARYKLPKAFRFVEHLQRQPNGKTDYDWAVNSAKEAT